MKKTIALRNLKLLNVLSFLFGFKLFDGVLAVYISSVTGSFTAGMSYYAIMHISAAFFEIPTGIISDMLGRKSTMISFYMARTVSILIVLFSTEIWHVVCAGILAGLMIALQSGTTTAFMYENVEMIASESDFKKYEGKRKAIGRYSATLSGFFGAVVIYFYSIEAAIAVTVVVLCICTGVSLFLTDVHVRTTQRNSAYEDLALAWKEFMSDTSLRQIGLGRLLSRSIGNAEYRFRSLFFSMLMPPWVIELIGAINNLLSAVFMQATHWIVEKVGYMRALVYADVLDRIIVTSLIVLRSTGGAFAMSASTSMTFGIREIAAEQLLQEKYTKDQRATMGSIVGMGGSIVYGVVAVSAGVLADKIGVFHTMLYLQPLLLIPTYFFYKGIKNNGKQGTSG